MDDVNPLIESSKVHDIQSRFVQWKSVTGLLFIKFRYQVLVCLTGLLVTLFLLVLLTFIFTGGTQYSTQYSIQYSTQYSAQFSIQYSTQYIVTLKPSEKR